MRMPPLNRRHRYRNTAVIAFVSITVTMIAACGGDEDDGEEASSTASPEQAVAAQIVTQELAVGTNRFSVGLVDQSERGTPILDAENVNLRFFKVLEGDQAQLRSEATADTVRFDRSYVNEQTKETVKTGEIAVYVANVSFDEAGDWGVEIAADVDGQAVGPFRLAFTVLPPEQVLSIGDPAPRTRQRIAADVADVSEIDTMQPPDPFHDVTIQDAISSGRPLVVLFGTPAFCETTTCAPVMNTVMIPLYEQYGDQAQFIHVEPYVTSLAREGKGFCPVPAFNREFAAQGIGEGTSECPPIPPEQLGTPEESWNLTGEPMLFVVDQQGVIAGKFDGPAGPDEVEAALQVALGGA